MLNQSLTKFLSYNAGSENLGIIFEFSPWVLKICPDDGLKVGHKCLHKMSHTY